MLSSPQLVYERLEPFVNERREHFVIICLDPKNKALTQEVVSIGIVNATLAHPREVFYPAILHNATSIIVAHNHPSGDTKPSTDDLEVTARLVAAGKILGIEVVDHVIVGREGYTSLREKGLM
jgi:DNA repair protein RadC